MNHDKELVEREWFQRNPVTGNLVPSKPPQQFTPDEVLTMMQRFAALSAELERVREALRPFADNAEYVDALGLHDNEYVDRAPFKAGDYRRAAAALATSQEEQNDETK